MKVVILAGGLGTRISEETKVKPKPMVEIGGKPILIHIMNIYSKYGFNDFIVCCGYKGDIIKDYFLNYSLKNSDIEIDFELGIVKKLKSKILPWKVKLVDTGQMTMTGGRLKRVSEYLEKDVPFCLTYGDGLSDVNISKLVEFHQSQNTLATLTAVKPSGRFGALQLDGETVSSFREKQVLDGNYINGGFFVLEKKVLDLIDGDKCIWEEGPLVYLSRNQQLSAFKHNGFWHPMDSLKDKTYLQNIWDKGDAPWL